MSGELSWFEIGVGDTERARLFYGELLGWQFEESSSGEGSVIRTPTIPGGLHGGDEGASPYVFFSVPDIDAAIAQVRELGGEITDFEGNTDDPPETEWGRFALCRDDQGSAFGLHQPPSPAD
jgi:predicted enzyme related to lactoylglutathione lyase